MLEQKTIVVTGGTKGIGKAVIEVFAKNQFKVITCARNESDLLDLKSEIENQHRSEILVKSVDLSKKDQVSDFISFCKENTNTIDVLINNTGMFLPGQIHTEEEGVLEKMIETNLYSAYHMSRGFVEDMKKKKSGHIFNICSTASITAYTNGGSYCITKFAMYGMSKVLREELKEYGIRVTSVLPGATFTASWEGVDIPEERFMPSKDVAQMIWASYSLSPRSVVEDLLIRPQLGDL